MTDDRNGGAVPPASGPAAPPPLAAPPPPVAPPQPQSAPPYYPPVSNSKTGLWVFFVILAFAVGVGGTILTLWLSGELWNSGSLHPPGSYGGSTTSTSTPYGSSTGTPPPPPSTSASGYPPTEASLQGTWGENCPGSRTGALTFYGDGTAVGDNERGTWSLNGNYVTLTSDRNTMTLYWEMLGNDTARARRSGDSQTRTVNRCP
jgi:hypothetical protein